MVEQGKHYFLSRPRRFGTSLFLETLKELFEGYEALFEGLAIHDAWNWSVRHPVLRVSFGSGHLMAPDDLQAEVADRLEVVEREAEVSPRHASAPARLAHVIRTLRERTGKRVAVLVDEYDKPILDALEVPDVARANRDFLRGLYAVVKDSDAHIRFSLITGVSKFSKVSLFLDGEAFYRLCYPNREVRQSLNRSLLRYLVRDRTRQTENGVRLYRLLEANDFEGLRGLFEASFASIPYEWYRNHDIAAYEGYYASVFYSYFAGRGFDTTVQDSSSHGHLDMAVRFKGHIYLFEFKVVGMAAQGAMAQLREKGLTTQLDYFPPRHAGASLKQRLHGPDAQQSGLFPRAMRVPIEAASLICARALERTTPVAKGVGGFPKHADRGLGGTVPGEAAASTFRVRG